MQKLLSIVVPSYNAEKYLEYNLNSLCLEGILDELEVIAVDDGSKDSTPEIIDRYADKYPGTVVPVHKENGGHGSGINAGIKHATGLYFRVIDADDWANGEDLKNLISYIKSLSDNLPDIIAGGFYWVYGHDDSAPYKAEFEKPFEGVEYKHIYKFDEVAEKAYIKMHSLTIRTEILKKHDIKIDEHCYYVDTEYILYPIPYVDTVVFLDDHLYRYSISRAGQSMNPQQMMKNKTQYDHVLEELFKFYEKASTMECVSDKKRLYIEHLISRVYASRIKILLWDRISPATRKELINMEENLKKKYPEIYRNNVIKVVDLFRTSGYWLYYPAAVVQHLKK
ncbi:glycosyltransferase family 2 protein [Oribacterium sp. FC2011]|uniref:glycosyltransferase family 2 protein n=1 Tax=Oribacterium sp. FC2011 TaxID=1408311 RepID=UPI0004E17B46|nr:glycosyltransferase family 2 protein [Oribacterium sp. FC2011]